jgi:hypothetical protein
MKISRAPEKRGGSNKTLMYSLAVVAIAVAAILVVYFATGFGPRFATGDQTGLNDLAVSPVQLPIAPVPDPSPTPAAEPESPMTILADEPISLPRVIPEVKFGEVLSEGLVDVDLPGNVTVESWYTFQVNTTSRDITLFFVLYGDSADTITRTVKVEGYTQRGSLNQAEVTLFYPEGTDRVIVFDREQGTINLNQQYQQPYGPSMFSPELRVALVNQNMELTDDSGDIRVQLQLDLTGLSDSEHLVFQRSAPELVDAALSQIQAIVKQIEDKRVQ